MKLPHAERAIVAREKVINYLLNLSHPQGGAKAAFFINFGFSAENWEALAKALTVHALTNEAVESEVTEYGTRYSVDAPCWRQAEEH